jgi:hypothetical protein
MSTNTPANKPATATPAAFNADALPALRVAAGRIFAAGRELKNYGQTVERICRDAACAYGNTETKAAELAQLPGDVARMIANAEAVADEIPALRRLIPAPAELDDRERALTRLGITVRVRYVRPSNTKGGRYVAEVCDDNDPARVYIGSQTHNRCESTRLDAAERCLAKWHANRVAWWRANVGKEWGSVPPIIHAKGSTGDAWLFFAICGA